MLGQRTPVFFQRPKGDPPPQGDLTLGGHQGARKEDFALNSTSTKALETWFPGRTALVTERGGSGRHTSARMLSLQLRLSGKLPASPAQPSPLAQHGLVTPGPGWRTVGQVRGPSMAAAASVVDEIAQVLQEAKQARWAGLERHAGSGRAPTARRLQISYNPVPLPLTPFVPTPVAPAQASPMPMTPAAVLIQSLLQDSPRSVSCASPMEGVPERFGFVLQPKTPAFVFTPMEGVPERMGLPDMTSGKRRLHEGDAADGDSPIEGVKGQKGRQEAVLADGNLAMGVAAGVQPSASQSSSFAFSRAGLAVKPGVQSCPEEPEAAQNANVHPLGFFAAEGARQLCHVEGVRMLDGAPKTPWRLRDYDDSPQLLQPPKRPRYSVPSSMQPPAKDPPAQEPQLAAAVDSEDTEADATAELMPAHDKEVERMQPEQDAEGQHGKEYQDDDDDFGGNDGGWDDGDNDSGDAAHHEDTDDRDADASVAHDEDAGASMAQWGAENEQPNSSSGPDQSQVQPKSAAKPVRSSRRPTSSNKRLRRDFQSRKSLAGDGLQVEGSLRRSTRRSIKPLDYWRNEKTVYERKFKSLPTVAGYTEVTPTPSWTFVSDYRKKPQHR